jgi:hypothetical protein
MEQNFSSLNSMAWQFCRLAMFLPDQIFAHIFLGAK